MRRRNHLYSISLEPAPANDSSAASADHAITIMKLVGYLHQQSGPWLLAASSCGIVAGLSGVALIVLISKGVAGSSWPLPELAALFFATALLHWLCKSASEIALLQLTQKAIYRLRLDLGHRILGTPQARLQQLGKPGLLVMLTKDIDSFTDAFIWLPIGFGNAIITLGCLGYLAWLSWQALLLVIVVLTIGLLLFFLAERRPRAQLLKVRAQMDVLYRHFRDLIEGSRELQLNRQRGTTFVHEVIGQEANTYRQAFTRGMTGYNLAVNLGAGLFFLMIGVLIYLLPRLPGQNTEVIATTLFILLYLVRPIAELVFAVPIVRQADIALQRLNELRTELEATTEWPVCTNPADGSVDLRAQAGWTLEITGLRHHYASSEDDSRFALGPIDLTLGQGEILFIVGGNGSGKTTLAMLLLGLYQADEGQIRVNGTPVDAGNIDAYRQNFSAVFADFHLFEDILENAAAQQQRVEHYLQRLGLAHKVKLSDGRYSTLNLSTGQRKRLALISAYIEDRPILLFDEWAADQDPQFKRVFYRELLPELKAAGKTVIAISHDDAYFDCADRLFKLADGQKAATASH